MRLFDYIHFLKNGPRILTDISAQVDVLLEQNLRLREQIRQKNENNDKYMRECLSSTSHRLKSIDDRVTDVLYRINNFSSFKEITSNSTNTRLLADNHTLDAFYVGLEKNFRGSEEEIKKRQAVHVSRFKKLKNVSTMKPVVDIGCGRGEFLELMSEANIECIGLDLNGEMVTRAKEKGFNAQQANAIKWLNARDEKSIAAVAGFHIVEHIPFDTLIEMFEACYRSLAQDGFALFESPNPENINVGACSFWMDPSHLRPLPPPMLEYALKFCGFKKIETIRLHPLKIKGESLISKDLQCRLYGPQDYAVIAYK